MEKKLCLPFIEGIEGMSFNDLRSALEKAMEPQAIDCVNWPELYPYKPECSFRIARSADHLAVLYDVTGMDLRAQEMNDNGRSWEDSCCECFIQNPADGSYTNFELTCNGSLLSANGMGREGRVQLPIATVNSIRRFSTCPHEQFDIEGEERSWSVALIIPLDLVCGSMRKGELRCNFYKCADLTDHIHFLSWNPIRVPQPDFHRPEFFGTIVL